MLKHFVRHFDNFHEYSVKIGNNKKLCMPSENVGCIPSSVVTMTTAERINPAFSGRHMKLVIISDLYLVVTEIAEVHADTAQSFLRCIIQYWSLLN